MLPDKFHVVARIRSSISHFPYKFTSFLAPASICLAYYVLRPSVYPSVTGGSVKNG